MKKILVYIFILPLLVLTACDKEGLGDNYNFDNKVAPYVGFRSVTTQEIVQGTNASIPLDVRTAIQDDLTITLKVTGGITKDLSIVLPKGEMSIPLVLPIPAGTIVPPATSTTVVVAVTKAVTSKGVEFSIGRLNDPATQKKTLNIVLPK